VLDPVFVNDISGKGTLAGRSALASLVVHVAAILVVLLVGGPVTHFIAQPRSVVMIAPSPEPARVHRLPVIPRHEARLALPPPLTPRLTLPVIEIPTAPVVEAVRTVPPAPELPHAVLPPAPLAPPAPSVKTGEFVQVTPATAQLAPQLSLHSSGFAAAENPRGTLPRSQLSAASAGFDSAGVTNEGPRHTGVSKSGFSDAAPSAESAPLRHAIAKSAFGDVSKEVPAAPGAASPAASLTSPVDILSKPRPAYTSEARALGIEGEVLVEVVFESGGSVRVVRLVKGLGHGLDESALEAAREIRFHPARRGGAPADATAVVHIVYQLAY
jgi:TonB family protein